MSVYLADEQAERVDTVALRRLAEHVLAAEGYPPDADVTLLLVGDHEIAEYNARFLGREGPTDVLAFPLEHLRPGEVPVVAGDGPPLVIGDVVISPAYVRRQSAALRVPFEEELALMVVHGILHLLGYDHENDADADRMESREQELLAAVGMERRR